MAEDSGGAPSTVSSPGVPESPGSRAIYDPDTGKLDVKKLSGWIAGLVALIGTLSVAGAKVNDWAKSWLGVDSLEQRAATCETQYEELDAVVHPRVPVRDANARLDEALPTIARELREGRKERQTHEQAITRLSTIHEYGLRSTLEREAARSARTTVQWAPDRPSSGERDRVESLEGL